MRGRVNTVGKILWGVFGAIVLAVIVVVLLVTQTNWGREHVLAFGLKQLASNVHGYVYVKKLHGNLLTGARLDSVVITDSARRPFLAALTLFGGYLSKDPGPLERAWNALGRPVVATMYRWRARAVALSAGRQYFDAGQDRVWDRPGDWALERFRKVEAAFRAGDLAQPVDFGGDSGAQRWINIRCKVRRMVGRQFLSPVYAIRIFLRVGATQAEVERRNSLFDEIGVVFGRRDRLAAVSPPGRNCLAMGFEPERSKTDHRSLCFRSTRSAGRDCGREITIVAAGYYG